MSDPYNPPRPFSRTSRYGDRIHPITGEPKLHAGEDWAAPEGTPIPSATPGEVVYSGFNRTGGLGYTVIVKTTNGYSLYAHMKEGTPRAQVGDRVWPGDTIGHVGSTGASTRSHLHYSAITSGTPNRASGGSIGVNLDKNRTTDPELFDTAVRFPNQTLQAGRAMFGPNSTHDAPAFGIRRSPLTDASPFHQFGFRPPDNTQTFADRFGSWTSPSSEGAGEESFADRFGDKPPVRRLSSWARPR
jgi:peptidase M23-like protein